MSFFERNVFKKVIEILYKEYINVGLLFKIENELSDIFFW